MRSEIEQTCGDLIALRFSKFGADTPEGHRCSNIEQGLENLPPDGIDYLTRDSTRDQRVRLLKCIRWQISDLSRMAAAKLGSEVPCE